jgi:hypothetical protein
MTMLRALADFACEVDGELIYVEKDKTRVSSQWPGLKDSRHLFRARDGTGKRQRHTHRVPRPRQRGPTHRGVQALMLARHGVIVNRDDREFIREVKALYDVDTDVLRDRVMLSSLPDDERNRVLTHRERTS